MPVVHERFQPSVSRAVLDKVMQTADLQPLISSRGFSRFIVNKPYDDEYTYTWSLPDNVQRKKAMYGAETVTAEYAYKTLKMQKADINIPQNCCIKDGLILMRYLPMARAVREAYPMYAAMKNHGVDIQQFNKTDGARILDPVTGHPIRERNERRDAAAGHYKRKPNPSMDEISADKQAGISSALAKAERFVAQQEDDIPVQADGTKVIGLDDMKDVE